MPVYTDQIARKFELKAPPQRIVSLVPSQTELLCDLGLEDSIVGVTKFCVHPKHLRKAKTIIGGTKKLHFDRINALNPDLIIANKEENNREDVEKLSEKYPVYVSDIQNLDHAQAFANDMGTLTGNEEKAALLNAKINDAIAKLKKISEGSKSINALYLIWKDPYMAAGTDAFITEMLNICGIENSLSKWDDAGLRYPETTIQEIKSLNPDVIFLSSEPYPFKAIHDSEILSETGIKTMGVDGEAFSWYGSRILHCLPYLQKFAQEISSFYR